VAAQAQAAAGRAGRGLSTSDLRVDETAGGRRLDAWLAERLPSLSRSRIQQLIESGHVRVVGQTKRAAHRLRVGETIHVEIPDPVAAEPQPEDIPLRVVHEDADLLVVDKPAGLVVHPGAGTHAGTLVNALLHHVSDLSGVGGVLRPGIVHRLDKGTSGLMVVAKNDLAHRNLSQLFSSRDVRKEYLAIVLGSPRPPAGRIEARIGRHPVQRKKMAVRDDGRAALSEYSTVERLDGAALVRVRIRTGRTHQIRVHLAFIGHPVAGDATYGGTRAPSSRRQTSRDALAALARPALHAATLAFAHPTSGEPMKFESPLPEDLTRALSILRPPASS